MRSLASLRSLCSDVLQNYWPVHTLSLLLPLAPCTPAPAAETGQAVHDQHLPLCEPLGL